MVRRDDSEGRSPEINYELRIMYDIVHVVINYSIINLKITGLAPLWTLVNAHLLQRLQGSAPGFNPKGCNLSENKELKMKK